MKGVADGVLELDAATIAHFDRCLGCMACVPACPSGVRYDLLIESTRAKIAAVPARTPADRAFRELLFAFFPFPARLKALAWSLFLYARSGLRDTVRRSAWFAQLPPRLAQLEKLAPEVDLTMLQARLPAYTPARGVKRGTVALVAGCVQRVFFPNVNAATIRVLAAEGFDVLVPRGQGCCGALSLHVGRDAEAGAFARALIASFGNVEGLAAIVINAAGCGSSLKQYGELLGDPQAVRFAAKVKDVSEFLAAVGPVAERRPLASRVAYHDACHLANAQRIRSQPRQVLESIPELEVVELPAGDQCCGSAGVYNLLEPESALEIGTRKVNDILSVGADVLASANPGCTLHLQSIAAARGERLRTAHPIEILDVALNW